MNSCARQDIEEKVERIREEKEEERKKRWAKEKGDVRAN
jgi:hypothetical protein